MTFISANISKVGHAFYSMAKHLIPLRLKISAKAVGFKTFSHFFRARALKGQSLDTGSLPRAFVLLEKFAAAVGVKPMFVARARQIFIDDTTFENSVRFLTFYIKLALDIQVPGSEYNHPASLLTDEERRETLLILEEKLERAKSETARNAIQVHLFRMLQSEPTSPDVKAYVLKRVAAAEKARRERSLEPQAAALQKHGFEALLAVKEIFEKHNKRFFLIAGTLLGFVRDRNFIRGDTDIDLGVFADEVSIPEMREMFADTNFYLDRDFEHQVGYFSKDGVLIEIFVCQRTKDCLAKHSYGETLTWEYPLFDLVEAEFRGRKFWIPEDSEGVLESNFGDWQRKPLFYDWAFDSTNGMQNENRENMIYLALRFREALEQNNRYLAEQCARELKRLFDIDHTNYFSNARELSQSHKNCTSDVRTKT